MLMLVQRRRNEGRNRIINVRSIDFPVGRRSEEIEDSVGGNTADDVHAVPGIERHVEV